MADFHDEETLREWLLGRPLEAAVVLSARAALRALPLSGNLLEIDPARWARDLVLPQFCALAPPWFAGKWPNQGREVRSAARSAAHSATRSVTLKKTTGKDYWNAVLKDAEIFENESKNVVHNPLWPDGSPTDVAILWGHMKQTSLALDQDWEVWTDWYEDRLNGAGHPKSRPFIMELERDRILVPTESDWKEGPAHVNAILADLEVKYRGKLKPKSSQRETTPTDNLEERLRALPPRQAAVVAARSSLRTLPLHNVLRDRDDGTGIAVYPHCRALAAMWFACRWPGKTEKVQAEAFSARAHASAVADIAARTDKPNDLAAYYLLLSAYQSIDAAYGRGDSAGPAAATAALRVHDLAYFTDFEKAYSDAVADDLDFFVTGGAFETLIRQPLWRNEIPPDSPLLWGNLKEKLIEADQDWHVWTDWYEDRLWGEDSPQSRPLIMELEHDRILTPKDEDWSQGPAYVNAMLAALERKYRQPVTPEDGDTESSRALSETAPFVFISYKREDYAKVKILRSELALQHIETWWDWDIPADVNYRSHIAERLEQAGCVLVLWSKDALHSDWLHEEAERGRHRNRLVQATLDGTLPLPPFSSRPVVDLSGWNGDSADPAFQKIIDGIRSRFSKVDTPTEVEQSLRDGIALKSRIAVTIEDNRLHLTETPPDGEKPVNHSDAAKRIVAEQVNRVGVAIEDIETSDRNFNQAELLPRLHRYLGALDNEDPDAIIVQPYWEPLGAVLTDEFILDSVGPGLSATFKAIVEHHSDVMQAIHKGAADRNEDRIDIETSVGPKANADKLAEPSVGDAIQEALDAVSDENMSAILGDSAPETFKASAEEYKLGKTSHSDYRPEVQERGKTWMDRAVTRITGAAVRIVEKLPALADSVISAEKLFAKLEKAIQILLRVFD